jgi:hypothetical protein
MLHKRYLIPFLAIMLMLLSCSLLTSPTVQVSPPQEPVINVETAVARTLAFDSAVRTAVAANLPPPVSQGLPPTVQPQAPTIQSLAPTVEPTQGPPSISVSIDTNCRKGPSTIYEDISYLLVGKTSEVVAKYQNGSWWVIKDPNNPGQRCWVWGQYASVTGNWQNLPEATQPPTPTTPALAMSIDGSVSTDAYVGGCPIILTFTWNVTSNLPVTMLYRIQTNYSPDIGPDSATFGPGTKTFINTGTFNADGLYWNRFVIDGPFPASEQVDFSVNCL